MRKRTDWFLHCQEVQTRRRCHQHSCQFDGCLWRISCFTLYSLKMDPGRFRHGKMDTEDEHMPCRPITVLNEQTFPRVYKVMKKLHTSCMRNISSCWPIQRISAKNPEWRFSHTHKAKWIPALLMEDQMKPEFYVRKDFFQNVWTRWLKTIMQCFHGRQNTFSILSGNREQSSWPVVTCLNMTRSADLRIALRNPATPPPLLFLFYFLALIAKSLKLCSDIQPEKSALTATCSSSF